MEMHEYFSSETITVAIEVSVSMSSMHELKWDLGKFMPGYCNLSPWCPKSIVVFILCLSIAAYFLNDCKLYEFFYD